jgi:fumarate hydratase class II
MAEERIERDSMGEVAVPAEALYGAQTARAAANFTISGRRADRRLISALGRIKSAAAAVNGRMGRLEPATAEAIAAAADEVAEGRHDAQFVVDVFQTGSGTSTNMNANEVIAARAGQRLAERGAPSAVHPNDHVNMSQSSNDVIPSAVHVAAALAIHVELVPALRSLGEALKAQSAELDDVVKVGRTHLQDAVPVRLGQEFGGYAAAVVDTIGALDVSLAGLCELAIGGTAVGTGLNAPPGFGEAVCQELAGRTQLPFREASDHFAAQSLPLGALSASAAMRSAGVVLGKIANDVRWLASGPRCGLGELRLPALQPGSSIMPGKVNPVIPEAVVQVASQVVGLDAAVVAAATGGVGSVLELHLAWPLVAANLLEAASLLTGAARAFEDKCVTGLTADRDRCRELVERSLMLATALAPRLGYDAAAELAKRAERSGRTIREVAAEAGVLSAEELEELLNVESQTGPREADRRNPGKEPQ